MFYNVFWHIISGSSSGIVGKADDGDGFRFFQYFSDFLRVFHKHVVFLADAFRAIPDGIFPCLRSGKGRQPTFPQLRKYRQVFWEEPEIRSRLSAFAGETAVPAKTGLFQEQLGVLFQHATVGNDL